MGRLWEIHIDTLKDSEGRRGREIETEIHCYKEMVNLQIDNVHDSVTWQKGEGVTPIGIC